ncbi:hypothetical protein A3A01_02410 [Candidatus Nomurabacteria bacterium RIFCSPLOWO2_01_FULL_39_17]|uniref:Uncharacterized protein n=1 Tax=Candidatus Nomurabacteria bacterium RIFCSPLOWO2_01_FULL_39_17 TaxID=1801770 RepID=A0A1F6WW91_9BACT|nr:MAG: hypothetical protein A3A01_02410 [Candidatus Nomurabacteria bacterium RIFCSPLOWO2_01_FULL_39_17]
MATLGLPGYLFLRRILTMDLTMLRRALWVFLRPLFQLISNLVNPEIGEEWLTELNKFNRREPCWVPVVKSAKVYLRRLFTFKLGATDGKDTYATARKAFRAYFDPDFENWGIMFSGVAPEAEIASDELTQSGKFSDFLGNIATDLEKRRVLGSQFLKLCRDNSDKLRGDGRANFFVLTKGDEAVMEDLSNVFVADVCVHDRGELDACLDEFRHDDVWRGVRGHRVFSPQQ